MTKRQTVRPDAQPGPLGHGYCWERDPRTGARCVHPLGHKAKGAGQHLYPYVRPAIRWP